MDVFPDTDRLIDSLADRPIGEFPIALACIIAVIGLAAFLEHLYGWVIGADPE